MSGKQINTEELEAVSGGKSTFFTAYDVHLSDGSRTRFYSQEEAEAYSRENPGSYIQTLEVYGRPPRSRD